MKKQMALLQSPTGKLKKETEHLKRMKQDHLLTRKLVGREVAPKIKGSINSIYFMPQKPKVKIATLNVKGLNNKSKQQNSLTLLKSYKLDLIMLQETNLNNEKTQEFLKQQWIYDSIWTKKTAILAGSKDIKFKNIQISHEERVITTDIVFKGYSLRITNVYAPPNISDRVIFFNDWKPQIKENSINIIARDFNVNLNPKDNRISQAIAQQDSTKAQLANLTKEFVNSADMSNTKPFLTFFQKIQNNRS